MPGSPPFDRSRRGSETAPEGTATAATGAGGEAYEEAETVLERGRPVHHAAPGIEDERAGTADPGTGDGEHVTTATASAGPPPEALALASSLQASTEGRVAGSAALALRQDEIRRSRLLARFGVIMSAAVMVSLFFLPGDPIMTRITAVAVSVVGIGNLWLWWLTRRPEHFRPVPVAIIWLSSAAAVSIGVVYFGVFSAAAMVMTLGIYFLSLGQSLALAVATYGICAGVQLGAALLFITGTAPDPGLITSGALGPTVLALLEALIQLILVSVLLMARASRKVTLSAVSEHEHMVRAVAHREALLLEARQDLERALQLGGLGRFTGQIVGSFRLGPILGRGSMGEVYEASHVQTGEQAAVKLLPPASLGNPSYVVRFLREVQVAARLDVPHVVKVLEVGDAGSTMPYLAMERLRGRDLAQILRDVRRLGSEQVIDLVDQVGRGIAAAAQAGIVHRDLKPQNLFLADQPAGPALWKILDFGVSKLAGQSGTLTQGRVVGTPVYMAPEQAQGLEVTTRADLYALAAIAYRCLTGHLPFRAKDVPTILYQVVYKMPPRPSALAEVPPEVDAVLLVAMAKDPGRRFDSALALTEALEDALRGRLDESIQRRARDLGELQPWRA